MDPTSYSPTTDAENMALPPFLRSHSLGTTPSSFSSASPFFPIPGSVTSQWPGSSQVFGGFDTATLAAHDYDVDARTGFMPPAPPSILTFPPSHEIWDTVLSHAINLRLPLGDSALAHEWRTTSLEKMPLLEVTNDIKNDEVLLRRGHKTLAWIMHFFIQTSPSSENVTIPANISLPLLTISQILDLPPVLTYSDDVLYNWAYGTGAEANEYGLGLPTLECTHTFTGTHDEAHFYMTSAYMELHGVRALALMRSSLDELFVSDTLALQRITGYLHQLSIIITDLQHILEGVRDGCDTEVFYHQIRPWFKGVDSSNSTAWFFEGVSSEEQPRELSGPSAGQSSLIHAIDVFLGVGSDGFRDRMRVYMPRRHRAFLGQLQNVRELVLSVSPQEESNVEERETKEKLVEAYNVAVDAMKRLRDGHFKVVAAYIIGPAARERKALEATTGSPLTPTANKYAVGSDAPKPTNQIMESASGELRGTGGSELAVFLRSVRDKTKEALVSFVGQGEN